MSIVTYLVTADLMYQTCLCNKSLEQECFIAKIENNWGMFLLFSLALLQTMNALEA